MTPPDRPRLTIDLDIEQKEALKKLLPWGTQRMVISEIIKIAITFIQKNGLGRSMDALLNGTAVIIIRE